MKTTFRQLPKYEIVEISPYLGGLYEVRKNGQPLFRSCLETCQEYVWKWGR